MFNYLASVDTNVLPSNADIQTLRQNKELAKQSITRPYMLDRENIGIDFYDHLESPDLSELVIKEILYEIRNIHKLCQLDQGLVA